MCLTNIGNKLLIAEKDLMVYKVLKLYEGTLVSPFYDMPYEFLTRYDNSEPDEISGSPIDNIYFVEGGFYHAYIDKDAAVANAKVIEHFYRKKCVIYNATIPRGTKYYLGNAKDICAKSIIINEELDNLQS